MARHDQKPRQGNYTCTKCREVECGECIDEIRLALFGTNKGRVCVCDHALYKATRVIDEEMINALVGNNVVPNEKVEQIVRKIGGFDAKDQAN